MAQASSKTAKPPAPGQGSEEELVGRKMIRLLERQLDDLATQRKHPNRTLLFGHVVVAHLLAFFNPVLRGLRSIQDIFEQPKVRQGLGTSRIPRSTLSDAQRLF